MNVPARYVNAASPKIPVGMLLGHGVPSHDGTASSITTDPVSPSPDAPVPADIGFSVTVIVAFAAASILDLLERRDIGQTRSDLGKLKKEEGRLREARRARIAGEDYVAIREKRRAPAMLQTMAIVMAISGLFYPVAPIAALAAATGALLSWNSRLRDDEKSARAAYVDALTNSIAMQLVAESVDQAFLAIGLARRARGKRAFPDGF